MKTDRDYYMLQSSYTFWGAIFKAYGWKKAVFRNKSPAEKKEWKDFCLMWHMGREL